MGSAPDEQGGGPPSPRMRRSPAQEALDELLFTLDICRRALPWDAHPEHYDRLRRIEGMVRGSLEHGERNTGRQLPGAGLRSAGGPGVG
jgi:hypothetical protein